MKMWHWAICGKHPAVKDYFHLGQNLPMFAALSEWIEKGYRGVAGGKGSPASLLSWRFWVGGLERDALLCGVLRDSSDSLGRPYPLLIVGSGSLADWGTRWDLVPQACEQSWNQMESLATRIFRNLKQLEDELLLVRTPQAHWLELAQLSTATMESGRYPGNSVGVASLESIESRVAAMAREREIFVSLDKESSQDLLATILVWHATMKKHRPEPPKAVFMGGNATASYVAFFFRPLMTQDFVGLWSV